MLGSLFRRLFLTRLIECHRVGRLAFFGAQAGLTDRRRFLRHHLAAVRKKRFVVYAKPPFTSPEAVLAYLWRYTHRVAISNRRLIAFDSDWCHLPLQGRARDGPERQRVMTLAPHEFIRRFLLHVLPRGFHRIRHYGLLASSARSANMMRARELLALAPPPEPAELPDQLGSVATLSLLWRTHDHHRDLRAMATTPRPASRACINREHPVVTRHGLRSPHTATPSLLRMPTHTLFTNVSANVLDISRGQIPILASPGEKSRSPSSGRFQRWGVSGLVPD